MNSVCLPKALIVVPPEILSFIKFRSGDLVTLSILVHSLYALIVNLKRGTTISRTTGMMAAMYQLAQTMITSTEIA